MTAGEPQRVALVTGGAVRVGRALSVGLARAGYALVVAYRSSDSEAREVQEEITREGGRCETARADLTDPAAAEELVRAVSEAHGRLDLLVNSAATFRSSPLLEVDAAEWDRVMSVNVRAPHLLVRAAADLLAQAGGSVVNVTDLSAFQAWSSLPHHSVSKAALAHLTRVQARALAPRVRVNAVAPGAVLRPEGWPDEEWEAVTARVPLGRAGAPQDVVDAVLYLARADYVTGQVLVVDGGRLVAPEP